MAAVRASIEWLSDDVLGSIFLLLPQADRIRNLPRVSRRWRTLMGDATMWPTLDVAGQGLRCRCRKLPSRQFLKWLRLHSPGLRELTLHLQGFDAEMVQTVLMSVVSTATQLQQLRVTTDDNTMDSLTAMRRVPDCFYARGLACVNRLSSLTRLEAAYIRTPPEITALDYLFASLPALEFVSLGFCTASSEFRPIDGGSAGAPHVIQPISFPTNLLTCTRLTTLNLSMLNPHSLATMFNVDGLPEGISELWSLRALRLVNCVTASLARGISLLTQLTRLEVFPEAFDGAHLDDDSNPFELMALPPALRVLDAARARVALLTQLTALECLRLSDTALTPAICSNAGDPRHLSSLQLLTSLELGIVEDAQLLHGFAGCTGLQELHLHGLATEWKQPLPYPHLTRLQLGAWHYTQRRHMLAMTSQLRQLEVLEVQGRNGWVCIRRSQQPGVDAHAEMRRELRKHTQIWPDLAPWGSEAG